METRILIVAGAIVLALVTVMLHTRVSSKFQIGLVYCLYAVSGLMVLGAFFVPSSGSPSCGYSILMAVVSMVFIWGFLKSDIMKYIIGIAGLLVLFALDWWLIENAAAANNIIILVIAVGGGIILTIAVIIWIFSKK